MHGDSTDPVVILSRRQRLRVASRRTGGVRRRTGPGIRSRRGYCWGTYGGLSFSSVPFGSSLVRGDVVSWKT